MLVRRVEAVRRVFAAHAADEVAIGAQAFQGHANLLPPTRAGSARQRGPAIGHKLLEIVRHGAFSALRAETWRIRQERASTISGPRAMFRDSGSSTARKAHCRAAGPAANPKTDGRVHLMPSPGAERTCGKPARIKVNIQWIFC